MTITLAQYIFQRLHQLNCRSIHGVPGDFFLHALDHIRPAGSRWIGNANELCAGYAADGYARAANQLRINRAAPRTAETSDFSPLLGAFMTTYGVGELSAINAVAGAFAESVPMVQIVGTPSREAMKWDSNTPYTKPIHHTLVNQVVPEYGDRFMDVYAHTIRPMVAVDVKLHEYHAKRSPSGRLLTDEADIAAEGVDHALSKAVSEAKPAYITLPSDMISLEVDQGRLSEPLVFERCKASLDEEWMLEIRHLLKTAKQPLIIADGLSYSMAVTQVLNEIISLTNIPAMSFTSGKGIINESLPSWSAALPNTTEYSQGCDVLLIVGPMLSDTNTARWSALPQAKRTILIGVHDIDIYEQGDKLMDVSRGNYDYCFKALGVLETLLAAIKEEPHEFRRPDIQGNVTASHISTLSATRNPVTQDEFWPAMSSYIVPDDTLFLANGTPLIGGRWIKLQSGCQVIASSVWNSIGSMLPCAQGFAAAKRDHNLPGRTIVFEGDGSFQVTCQAMSDIIRYKLDVTIFIINNAGYTYERWLHGEKAEYNDVPAWRYVDAPSFFGARLDDPSYPIYTRRIETCGQLLEVLEDEKAGDGKGLKVIDVVMDPMDVPSASKPGLRKASEALRTG